MRRKVVVIDAGRGRRLTAFGLSKTASYLEMAVIPGSDGASPSLAILAQTEDGTVRVLRREAATGTRQGRVGFGTTITPAALVVLPAEDGGSRLVLVGNDSEGTLFAVARRAGDGRLVARLRLSSTLAAVDAVATAAAGGGPLLAIVAADRSDGVVYLVSLDPVSGAQAAVFPLANLAEARAVARLADVGGGPSADVAVLGTTADGTLVATVADPLTGSLLAAPEFPAGYPTDDLVSLGPGGALAALGRAPGDGSVLTLRHAATGASLGSYPVP